MNPEIKYYTDENVPSAIASGLRLRGIDVLTCQEAGMLGASDEEHLRTALELRRIIFTQDADFLRLHARGARHAGIVFAAQGASIGKIVSALALIAQVFSPDELINWVEYL